jgi:hypothetical protein
MPLLTSAMTALPRYLYRALRGEEISAGCRLIPKAQKAFLEPPRLKQVLPFTLGDRLEHAVRAHQWDEPGNQYKTSGVSTTPHLERARYYAENDGPSTKAGRMVATIDTALFEMLEISAHRVADYVERSMITVPEDDEIVLLCQDGHQFPKELIVEIEPHG